MIVYEKLKIREALTTENVFDILQDFGADPSREVFGFVCATVCHNPPGEGSRKLYYYDNTGLFKCFTGCDEYFDIFQLVIKVAKIQWDKDFDLNDAVRWVAQKFGIAGDYEDGQEESQLEDWKILSNYERIQNIELKTQSVILKEYEADILDRFNYAVSIEPWLQEGITQESMNHCRIGFYPGGDQITIPHYDADGRFIGLRGRTICAEEGERFGKYRPLKINKLLYNHPLGMNLYNLNNSKDHIKVMKKAVIFEGKR